MVSELSEQIFVVRELRKRKVVFCSVPNGGRRDLREASKLKASGVEAGVPDILIFDPPPQLRAVGTALEMKRAGGGRLSDKQKKWLELLRERGWHTLVAHGAEDALAQLAEAGYEVGCIGEKEIHEHSPEDGC
jgi:hypothetical protein